MTSSKKGKRKKKSSASQSTFKSETTKIEPNRNADTTSQKSASEKEDPTPIVQIQNQSIANEVDYTPLHHTSPYPSFIPASETTLPITEMSAPGVQHRDPIVEQRRVAPRDTGEREHISMEQERRGAGEHHERRGGEQLHRGGGGQKGIQPTLRAGYQKAEELGELVSDKMSEGGQGVLQYASNAWQYVRSLMTNNPIFGIFFSILATFAAAPVGAFMIWTVSTSTVTFIAAAAGFAVVQGVLFSLGGLALMAALAVVTLLTFVTSGWVIAGYLLVRSVRFAWNMVRGKTPEIGTGVKQIAEQGLEVADSSVTRLHEVLRDTKEGLHSNKIAREE